MILIPLLTFVIVVFTLHWLFNRLGNHGRLFLLSAGIGIGVYALIGMLVSPSHPLTWHFILGFGVAALAFVVGSSSSRRDIYK